MFQTQKTQMRWFDPRSDFQEMFARQDLLAGPATKRQRDRVTWLHSALVVPWCGEPRIIRRFW